MLWGDRGDAVFLAALRAQAEDFARSVRRGEIGVGATNDDAFRALEIAERAQRHLGLADAAGRTTRAPAARPGR